MQNLINENIIMTLFDMFALNLLELQIQTKIDHNYSGQDDVIFHSYIKLI